MTCRRIAVAVLIALLGIGAATAQTKATKKLYRWVDADGKVQFSDALPPEAIDQARREFNASSGDATGTIDRALTAEERAAQTSAAASAAELAAREELRRRQEHAMLTAYETEADLIRAFNDRVDLLKRTIEGIEVSITNQRVSLLSQLASAAEAELGKRKVDEKRAQNIRSLHDELVTQQDMLMRREAELNALDQEFEQTLARYRELREEQSQERDKPDATAGSAQSSAG